MISFKSRKGKERQDDSGDKEAITSIIDKDMVIVGDLSFNGKTMLDGRVEGNVRGKYLIISESGNVVGDIEAEVVICQGRVKGNIRAARLHARNSATITGMLEVEDLAVDSGASLNGEVKARTQDLRLVEEKKEAPAQKKRWEMEAR